MTFKKKPLFTSLFSLIPYDAKILLKSEEIAF